MIESERTIINGIELPEEFADAAVFGNLALSRYCEKYAYVSNGELIQGFIPVTGNFEVGGMKIYHNYKKFKLDGTKVLRISKQKKLFQLERVKKKVYEFYNPINKVKINDFGKFIKLGLSSDRGYVTGRIQTMPVRLENTLQIDEFDGSLKLPKDNEDFEIDISSMISGKVKGNIAHGGNIKLPSGTVNLNLHAPLTVKTRFSIEGNIHSYNMDRRGAGIYTPRNEKSIGTLNIEMMVGKVYIKYKVDKKVEPKVSS